MELSLVGSKKSLAVSDAVFGADFREDLVHQVVNAYRAGGRAGTKKQKSRSDMSGTTKKFKKQKGGGARHGDYRAPIFVGGGVTFAARPRDFTQKVNKKMYRAGMTSILSRLARDGRIAVVDGWTVDSPKTKPLAEKLKAMGLESVLIITEAVDENLYLASRNLKNVMVVEPRYADPLSLIHYKNVVVTRPAIAKLEEMWG